MVAHNVFLFSRFKFFNLVNLKVGDYSGKQMQHLVVYIMKPRTSCFWSGKTLNTTLQYCCRNKRVGTSYSNVVNYANSNALSMQIRVQPEATTLSQRFAGFAGSGRRCPRPRGWVRLEGRRARGVDMYR